MDPEVISSSKPLGRRALLKKETVRRLLEKARELFAKHGYKETGIRDIAAGIGMSTGAVFANFGSKKKLFREAVASEYDGYRDVLERVPLNASPCDKLVALLAIDYKPRRLGFLRVEMELSWSAEGRDASCARHDYVRNLLRKDVMPFSAWADNVFDLFFFLVWSAHLELCRMNAPDRACLAKVAQRAMRMIT
jgi:AcrR family transcriptional regulator